MLPFHHFFGFIVHDFVFPLVSVFSPFAKYHTVSSRFFFHHGFSNSIRMLLSRWSCKCICWSPITCAMYVKHAHIIQIFAVLLLKIRMVNGFKTTVDLAVQRVLFFFRCQLENDRIGIFLFDGHLSMNLFKHESFFKHESWKWSRANKIPSPI